MLRLVIRTQSRSVSAQHVAFAVTERGCVEDQPQRLALSWRVRAGRRPTRLPHAATGDPHTVAVRFRAACCFRGDGARLCRRPAAAACPVLAREGWSASFETPTCC